MQGVQACRDEDDIDDGENEDFRLRDVVRRDK